MAETEIIARRRKWRPEEKAALLAEVEAEGGRVAIVARRHGLSESLLYNWRSVARAAWTNEPEPMEFRPIGVVGRLNEAAPALLASEPAPATGGHRDERGSKIEIALPNGVRLRVNGSVSEKALSRVLRAVKGAL
ncbi:MAG: transposase [Acetobacteraceae bacterium]|nr:transposase [Acetobacteraceae bacterium]